MRPVALLLVLLAFIACATPAQAQCFGTFQFPSTTIVADDTGVPTTISTCSFAGDHAVVSLIAGRNYRFTSSIATDHITVSSAVASGALASGTQPLLFTATATQTHFIHFHTDAACATQNSCRSTQVTRVLCAAGANNCGGTNEAIVRVSIGAINNLSAGCGGGGYTDFSTQVTGILTGTPLPITVQNLNAFTGDQVRVFVDWNNDFAFGDANGEFILSTTNNITFTGSITAPPGTAPGNVRMRVRLTFTGSVLPCGNTTFGEVEDYTLNVGTFGDGVFAGGNGRGDTQAAILSTPIASNIYSGGNGRGDTQAAILSTPIASNIYSGGDGRGDVLAAIANTPIPSNIYSGGNGRGDIQARIIPGLNDLCILPDTIAVQPFGACTPTTGSTLDADQDGPAPPCDAGGFWPDVWYTFNSGPNTSVVISTTNGTATDLVVQVLSGACPGVQVACQIAGNAPLTFTVAVAPFTEHRVRIATNTNFGSSGTFTLCVTEPPKVSVNVRAVLEGPYAPATGLMNDALRALPSFPTTEPYTALGYVHVNGGNETIAPAVLATTGNNAIVDWVVLELRDNGDPAIVLGTRSALLQRDGDVVDTDGISPVTFDLLPGTYRVALRHRNHLGVMTLNGIALGTVPLTVDLSLAATATFGTDARKSITGTFPALVLWQGDVTRNGQIKYIGGANDRDPILVRVGGTSPTNTVSGYFPEDCNLDGTVKYTGGANDRDPILLNIGGSVPTNIRNGQLP